MALSPQEITARMIELRNLRTLHGAQKIRIQKLEVQVRLLKQESKELRAQNALLTVTVSDIQLQMEELRTNMYVARLIRDGIRTVFERLNDATIYIPDFKVTLV